MTALRAAFVLLGLSMFSTPGMAHPGSGIVVDSRGQVFFIDTGQGVWMVDAQGQLNLIYRVAYHWMALDEKGHFARSNALGEFDRGTFERATPAGATPAILISSDYPIAVGRDGGLYYVPYNKEGPRQLVRKMPDGSRSVFATLPPDAGKKMQWVNGIVPGPDGSLYFTDNNAVFKVAADGRVSTIRGGVEAPDCAAEPLLDVKRGDPYLRGLAVQPDGTIYVAANGCRTVIRIAADGVIKTILKAEAPWSPTGVALSGKDLLVLEYTHTPTEDRREWIPRVRKVAADGKITTVATVKR